MKVTAYPRRRAVTKHSTVRLKPPWLLKKRNQPRRTQRQILRSKVSVGL